MKYAICSITAILVALTLGAAVNLGMSTQPYAAEPLPTVVSGDAVKWGPAPASLPPGAQASPLLGSPAKEGPFVLRLKFPAGFVIPPHRHSKDEFVTVIAGKVAISSGETVDPIWPPSTSNTRRSVPLMRSRTASEPGLGPGGVAGGVRLRTRIEPPGSGHTPFTISPLWSGTSITSVFPDPRSRRIGVERSSASTASM